MPLLIKYFSILFSDLIEYNLNLLFSVQMYDKCIGIVLHELQLEMPPI